MEVQQPVCPESTIESAVQRNAPQRKVVPPVSIINDKSNNESKLACESTIDSSFRRDFIKKAALFGAAAAVGSTLLGSRLVPESSASSCTKSSSVHPDSSVFYCCPIGTAIWGATCSGTGVFGHARGSGIGVHGAGCCSYGVKGCSVYSAGVYGESFCNTGVFGKSCSGFGVIGSSGKSLGVYGHSCCSYAVEGSSAKSTGVHGVSCCFRGVEGFAYKAAGVYGSSTCSYGVHGSSAKLAAVYGCGCSIGVEGYANNSCAIPIVAKGHSCQSANLQQWRNVSCAPLSVVNKCGWLGLGTNNPTTLLDVNGTASMTALGVGTTSPQTTLQVNGSLGAKVATPSCSTYCVGDSCFAVLVNATAAAKTVNLPKAIQGMILYIKNTGTDFEVTIKPKSGDTIEGATSKLLKKKFGVQLIAGGNSPATWYIISYIS